MQGFDQSSDVSQDPCGCWVENLCWGCRWNEGVPVMTETEKVMAEHRLDV